jgi:YVTN family beta-propeller protein
MRWIAGVLAVAVVAGSSTARAEDPQPLALEAKIPLGDVKGRIDHFASDTGRKRLFVAELGNDSVGVVDVAGGKVVNRIAGLKEPQGVGYVPWTDTLYIANAGDGSVRLYRGADLAPAGRIDLGDDADNVRVDVEHKKVYVGYGKGALAEIDPSSGKKAADIPLKGHPEGFQIDPTAAQIFVNVPNARQIAVVDLTTRTQASAVPTGTLRSNFPIALDPQSQRVLVMFRSPPRLYSFAAKDGAAKEVEACGDSDDVFVDAKRRRVYVSCGEGFVDVFDARGTEYPRVGHIPTVSGARTSFFVPELDRLFVAVRASGKEPAAVWVFRPTP